MLKGAPKDYSDREFALLFQKIMGADAYVDFIWRLRDSLQQGAGKSTGLYPIQTLRTAQPNEKVAQIKEARAKHARQDTRRAEEN